MNIDQIDPAEFRKFQDIIDNQADQILDLHEVLKSAYALHEFIAGAYVHLNVVSTKIKAALPGGNITINEPQTSAVGLTNLAETIHNARWPEGKDARSFIPFQEEDRSGQDYCTRIARAIMSEYSLSRPQSKGGKA